MSPIGIVGLVVLAVAFFMALNELFTSGEWVHCIGIIVFFGGMVGWMIFHAVGNKPSKLVFAGICTVVLSIIAGYGLSGLRFPGENSEAQRR